MTDWLIDWLTHEPESVHLNGTNNLLWIFAAVILVEFIGYSDIHMTSEDCVLWCVLSDLTATGGLVRTNGRVSLGSSREYSSTLSAKSHVSLSVSLCSNVAADVLCHVS